MRVGTWYGLKFLLDAKTLVGTAGLFVRAADRAVTGICYLVPTYDPFSDRTATIHGSMRASGAGWLYLVGTAAYAVAAVTLFYLVSSRLLRRRSLA